MKWSRLQYIILNNIPLIIQMLWFLFIFIHYMMFLTYDISMADEQSIDTKELLAHFKFMLQCNASINAEHLVSWDLFKDTYLNFVNTDAYHNHVEAMTLGEIDICTDELNLKYERPIAACICTQAVENFYTKYPFHLHAYDYAEAIDKFIAIKQESSIYDTQALIKAIEAYTLPQAVKAMVNPEVIFDIAQSLTEVDICLTELQLQGLDISAYIDNTIKDYLDFLKDPQVQQLALELSEQPRFKNLLVKKQLPTTIRELNTQIIESWYLFDNVNPTLCGISHAELKELKLHYLRVHYQYDPMLHTWSGDLTYKGIPSENVFFEELNKKGMCMDRENYRLELPQALMPKKSYIVINSDVYDIDEEFLHLDAFLGRLTEQGVSIDNYIAQVTLPYITIFKLASINELSMSFIAFVFPELFLGGFIIVLLLFNLIFKKYFIARDFVKFNICFSFLCLFFLFFLLSFDLPINFFYLNFSFISNNWIIKAKLFLLLLVFIVLLLSIDYFKFEKFQVFEYPILILLSLLGMFILISANDFIIVYLAIELQSFCFYILSALKRYSNLSIEAALKYFILGSFSSGILLFGISFIYGFIGTLNFNEINTIISFYDISDSLEMPIIFSLVFITLGVLFKLGVVPFHFWLPDVYEGSPTVVTAMFSILTKFSFLVLFIKLYFFVFLKLSVVFNNFFLLLALFSIIIGSVMSLYQVKIKRLLAYSGITHMGYILLALALFSLQGLQAFLVYFLIYIILSANIFSVILAFRHYISFSKIRNVVEFAALLKPNFFLVIVFAFTLLSFAGVPPLAGFFGKFLVFYSLMVSYNYFIALCVVLLSVLGSVYYIS